MGPEHVGRSGGRRACGTPILRSHPHGDQEWSEHFVMKRWPVDQQVLLQVKP